MHSIKPEWDTPPNGDFASYVERLSAQQALQAGRSQAAHSAQVVHPGGAAPGSAQAAARRAAANPTPVAVALPPDLLQLVAPFVGMVRIARTLLAVVAAVHALTLLMAGQGSWFVLAVMAGLWWFMGIVINAASAAGTVVVPKPVAVKERQRQAAQQRKTGNKK
jgi:hypothetical protein